ELGHALGLKHPFTDPNGVGGEGTSPFLGAINRSSQNGPASYTGAENDAVFTIMSYNSSEDQWQLKFSDLDIAALQYLWGPSKTTRSQDTTYVIDYSGGNYGVTAPGYTSPSSFIWDGNGNDRIDASSVTAGNGVTVYLTPGYWGYVNALRADTVAGGDAGISDSSTWVNQRITAPGQITINFGTSIEHLKGSPDNDFLFGNELGNSIEGGSGGDSIEGWAGGDTLVGGSGDDTLRGGTGDDNLTGGEGTDTAAFSGAFVDYTIAYDLSTQTFTIIDKTVGRDGTDKVFAVERFQFSDGTKLAANFTSPLPESPPGPTDWSSKTTSFLNSLTQSQWLALRSDDLGALTTVQWSSLYTAALGFLSTTQWTQIQTDDLVSLKVDRWGSISTMKLDAMLESQWRAMTSDALRALSSSQWQSVATDDLQALNQSQWQSLATDDLRALTSSQWQSLATDDLQALGSSQWSMVETVDLVALTSPQWQAMATDDLRAL
ncbi:MAG: hypothetical protein EBT58_08480, partial [Betaproteobacteria bacterium]|nr:hypothetical protein [Betaproteobacteria bacterium]